MHPFQRPGIFGAGMTVAVLSTLVLSAGIGSREQEPTRERQPIDAAAPAGDRALTEQLTDLREAAMEELEDAAAAADVALEASSLLLASTYEGGLFAGAAVADGGSAPRSEDVEDERVGRPEGAALPGEALGMFLIAVSGVTEGTGAAGGASTTKANVAPGNYEVRRDTAGLQLVNPAGDVVLTVPFTPPTAGSNESGEMPADTESAAPGDGPSDWPKIYMAIVHALDPRLRP